MKDFKKLGVPEIVCGLRCRNRSHCGGKAVLVNDRNEVTRCSESFEEEEINERENEELRRKRRRRGHPKAW